MKAFRVTFPGKFNKKKSSHLNSMLLEDIVSLLHLLDFQLNAQRRRLDRVYRAHDNLEVCQLLNVSIEVQPKILQRRKKGY
jgi:hypothetical protein